MISIDWVKSLEYTEKALKLYEDLHRPKLAALAHWYAGKMLTGAGAHMDVRRALEHHRKAQALLAEFEGHSATRFSALIDFGLSEAALRALLTSEGLAASRRAMETAQRLGDDDLFVTSATILGHHLFYAGQLTDAFTLLERTWEKGDNLKDPLPAHGAAWVGGACHMSLGDYREARMWFERELSKSWTNTPFWRGMFAGWLGLALMLTGKVKEALPLLAQTPVWLADTTNGLIHLWQGGWEQAESLLTRSLDRNRQAGGREPNQLLAAARRMLGKHASAAELLLEALAPCRDEPLQFIEMWARPELAQIYAQTGRAQEAFPHLSRCREIMVAGENWRGMAGGVLAAEAVVGAALCHPGSMSDRPQASSVSAHETQARFRQVQAQFEQAAGIYHHYQAPLAEAGTLCQWGHALIRASRHADGAEKIDAAVELYRHCGAGGPWIEQALAVKADEPAAIMTNLAGPAEAGAIFRREADYWTICFSGAVCRLRDAKGLHYIAHLLRHPGVEFKAIDLAQTAGPKGAGRVDVTPLTADEGGMQTRRDLGDAGPLLDPKAKADYRRRLHELGEELEESGRLNDLGRKERLREEIEVVTAELTAAIGRGGRDRKVGSHLERARWMVSKRIRFSVNQIQRVNPALGSYLTQSVRTGNYCAYLPKQPVDWHF